MTISTRNHGPHSDMGSDLLELFGHVASFFGNDGVRRDAVAAQPCRHVGNMRERIRATAVLLGNFRNRDFLGGSQ